MGAHVVSYPFRKKVDHAYAIWSLTIFRIIPPVNCKLCGTDDDEPP